MRPIAPRRASAQLRLRDEQGRKQCSKCSIWLPEADFVRDPAHSDGLTSYCKACRSIHARAWKYGTTPEGLERIAGSQGGMCATCSTHLADGFCVDHDHSCCPGAKTCGNCIRGLLCQECNKLIGKLEGDRARLARILDYIKEG